MSVGKASQLYYQGVLQDIEYSKRQNAIREKKLEKLNETIDKIVEHGKKVHTRYTNKQELDTWLENQNIDFDYDRDTKTYTSGTNEYEVSLNDMLATKTALENLALVDKDMTLKEYMHKKTHKVGDTTYDRDDGGDTPIKQIFQSPDYQWSQPISSILPSINQQLSNTAWASMPIDDPSLTAVKTFKHGGQYVTDGPEMIMVGDNPGGKEVVEVTPVSNQGVSSKETNPQSQKGRFGDTKIRILDGEKQHVTAFEAWLVDSFGDDAEDVILQNTLARGGPSINPETGLKENWTKGAGFFTNIGGMFAGMSEEGGLFEDWEQGGGFFQNLAGAGEALSGAAGAAQMAMKLGGAMFNAGGIASENKRLSKELGTAIEGMRQESSTAVGRTQDEIDNALETVATAHDTQVDAASGEFKRLEGAIAKMGRGAGALDTSAVENLTETFEQSMSDTMALTQESLTTDVGAQIDSIQEQTEEQMVLLAQNIRDAKRRLSEARKMDSWGEAFVGSLLG